MLYTPLKERIKEGGRSRTQKKPSLGTDDSEGRENQKNGGNLDGEEKNGRKRLESGGVCKKHEREHFQRRIPDNPL